MIIPILCSCNAVLSINCSDYPEIPQLNLPVNSLFMGLSTTIYFQELIKNYDVLLLSFGDLCGDFGWELFLDSSANKIIKVWVFFALFLPG